MNLSNEWKILKFDKNNIEYVVIVDKANLQCCVYFKRCKRYKRWMLFFFPRICDKLITLTYKITLGILSILIYMWEIHVIRDCVCSCYVRTVCDSNLSLRFFGFDTIFRCFRWSMHFVRDSVVNSCHWILCFVWNRMKRQKNVRDFEKKFTTKTAPVFYFFCHFIETIVWIWFYVFQLSFPKKRRWVCCWMNIEKNWYCSHLMSNQF